MLREMSNPTLDKAKQALVPVMRHTILVELEPIDFEGQQVHESHHKHPAIMSTVQRNKR